MSDLRRLDLDVAELGIVQDGLAALRGLYQAQASADGRDAPYWEALVRDLDAVAKSIGNQTRVVGAERHG